jgi:hypothetical protein
MISEKQNFLTKFFAKNKPVESTKFGFASNIWACLSVNITIYNIVIGIINEPRKLLLRDILKFTLFSFRTQTFISILAYVKK